MTDYAAAHAARRAKLDALEAGLVAAETEIEDARREARARRGKPIPAQVRLAALHEAGHAVVAIALGRVVGELLVRDDGSGWMRGHAAGPPAHAGAASEQVLGGNVGGRLSPSDLRSAGEGDHRLDRFAAEEILAENADAVDRLADALACLGYLDGAAVTRIVGTPRVPSGVAL